MNTTSLTLQAKIFGLSVVGVGLLGITIASPLVVDQPSLDNIKIGKIFLSSSGTSTIDRDSKIILDGSNGSVELKGNLTMPGYGRDCTSDTGCILTTDADGKVVFATINVSQQTNSTNTTTAKQPSFFTRRGGNIAQVDTGASEIVFYDRTIIGNNANSNVSLRIGLSGAINSASQGNGKTVDVAGPIMSRTALSLESPIITNQSENYLFSPNRTSAVIQKSTSSDTIEAMKLQVGHTTDDGASYDRSDFIIESLSNSIKARLGINTPNYPSKELDINGQTLSRGNLTVGSGSSPTLLAHTISKRVGIQTSNPRASLDVVGATKFNGSLTLHGTPEHISNTTSGMTSITLGEITSNETGNLRTLADVGCKLLTVDNNGTLVLQQIPEDICKGTTRPTTPPQSCTSGRTCLYGNTLTGDTNNDGIPNCTWRQPQLVSSEIGCQYQIGQPSCVVDTVACICDIGDNMECFRNVEVNFPTNRQSYVGSATISSCHDKVVIGDTVSYRIYKNEYYPRQERGNATCSSNICTTGPSTGRVQTDECLPGNAVYNPDTNTFEYNKCLGKRFITSNTCRTYITNPPIGFSPAASCYEGLLGDPSYQAVMLKPVTQSCTVCPTGQSRDADQRTCKCDNSGLKPTSSVIGDDNGDLIYTSNICNAPSRYPNSSSCNGSTYTVSYTCKVGTTTVADSYCSQPKPSNQTVNCSSSQPLKMYQCQGMSSNTIWTEITQGPGQQCYENTYDYELIYHFGLHTPPYGVDSVQYYKEGSYVCHTQTPSIPCLGGHGWINLFYTDLNCNGGICEYSYNELAACECNNSGRKSGCTCSALID